MNEINILPREDDFNPTGSQSAKQLLKKISGKEDRRMKHVDHEISKTFMQEAQKTGAGIMVLEKLTTIRERIKAGKRMRTRLHRWSFSRIQRFIEYKAEAKDIRVIYVNPAYSSQLCSRCGQIGTGKKHGLVCMNTSHYARGTGPLVEWSSIFKTILPKIKKGSLFWGLFQKAFSLRRHFLELHGQEERG